MRAATVTGAEPSREGTLSCMRILFLDTIAIEPETYVVEDAAISASIVTYLHQTVVGMLIAP